MLLPRLIDLGLFMGLMLTFALSGLTASGHFPAEHRGQALRSGGGVIVLWIAIASAVIVLGATIAIAIERLPLYAAIIAGGAMLLAAPLVLQRFPDSFVDGPIGLLTFTGLGLTLLAVYHLSAG